MTSALAMEYRLYKSRRKALVLLLGCALFVAPPVVMSLKKPLPGHLWLGVGFFGLGMLLGLRSLLDKKPQIILDEDGVWDRSLRRDRIPWEMIEDAYPVSIVGQKFISLVMERRATAELKAASLAARANSALGIEPLNLNIGQIRVDADRLCAAVKLLAHLPREERATLLMVLKEKGEVLLPGR